MGPVERTKVSLRFVGDDLDPDEVTLRIGASPSHAERRGATVRGARVARRGGWRLASPLPDTEDLASHVHWLFGATTKDLAVWRDLSSRYRGNLFVGLFLGSFNEGVELDAATLAGIGERGLELGLDIYGRDGSEG